MPPTDAAEEPDFDSCPNWRTADERLRTLADELGFRIAYRQVTSTEDAEALSFPGSPPSSWTDTTRSRVATNRPL
ncbi:MAG: hypothetical protein ACRDQ7_26860 [Haloechinothrix sp.]